MRNTVIYSIFFLLLVAIGCRTTQNNATLASSEPENNDKSPEKTKEIYNPTQQRRFDLIHTSLNVSFNWQERQLNGTATLILTPYFYEQDFLILDAKNFEIHGVKMENAPLEYEYESDELIIDLNNVFTRSDTFSVTINYTALPYREIPNNKSVTSYDNGLYFINNEDSLLSDKPQQIWTQGQTEYNSKWFPTIDTPNERCTQDIKITVDKKFKTLSNGILVYRQENQDGTRTDHWQMDKPHAPYLFSMVVGEFSLVKSSYEDLPVSYWVEDEYSAYAKDIFGDTPDMIRFFSQLLDYPFPSTKYDQIGVRDYVSGGMENTTASVFMEELLVTDRELIDENWEGIISHELFHQWFGNLVTCESWANLPLNEAFATYGEQLWIEHKYGREEAEFHAMNELNDYLLEASEKKEALIRFDYEDKEDMFDNHTYAKGARVLHMLRNYVGDEAFFESLNLYLRENEYQSVEIHDLRMAFEKVTGEDLNWFFEQWFMSSGHPELRVNHTYSNDTLYIYVEQLQDLDHGPVYKLPVYLDLFYDSATYRYPLLIEDESHIFRLPLSEKPQAIILDGDYQIVGVLDHEKSNEELRNQLRLADSFSGRYESLIKLLSNPTTSEWSDIVKLGLEDPSKHIRELTLEMLLGLEPDQLVKFKEDLLKAAGDSASNVRSVAFELLYMVDMSPSFWLQSVNDSSLIVQGIVLDYLLANDTKADSLYSVYSQSEFIEILVPIAFYINQQNDSGQLTWYLNHLDHLNKSDIYYLLQPFNEYLMNAAYREKEKAAEFLFELAKNHINYMVRYSAMEGLFLIRNVGGVGSKIREAKSLESDPILLRIYSEM